MELKLGLTSRPIVVVYKNKKSCLVKSGNLGTSRGYSYPSSCGECSLNKGLGKGNATFKNCHSAVAMRVNVASSNIGANTSRSPS